MHILEGILSALENCCSYHGAGLLSCQFGSILLLTGLEYLGMVFILRICSRDKDFACNIVWLGAGIKGRMMIVSHLLPEQ